VAIRSTACICTLAKGNARDYAGNDEALNGDTESVGNWRKQPVIRAIFSSAKRNVEETARVEIFSGRSRSRSPGRTLNSSRSEAAIINRSLKLHN
jgi:hypothetical protein